MVTTRGRVHTQVTRGSCLLDETKVCVFLGPFVIFKGTRSVHIGVEEGRGPFNVFVEGAVDWVGSFLSFFTICATVIVDMGAVFNFYGVPGYYGTYFALQGVFGVTTIFVFKDVLGGPRVFV